LIHGSGREELSAAFAVFAMLFNSYPNICDDDMPNVEAQDGMLALYVKHKTDKVGYDNDHVPTKLYEAKQRLWRARYAAEICTTQPKYLKKHSDSLLLLGIGGLLDSFAVLGFSRPASDVAKIVADGLDKIPASALSSPMNIPYILPTSFDVRVYILDVITRALNPSPFEDPTGGLKDDSKAKLLRCISKKRLWANFGHQLMLPVAQLLHSSNDVQLQIQCLDGLDECCERHSSCSTQESGTVQGSELWHTLFAFNIPYRVLQLIKDSNNDQLRSKALNTFFSITSNIQDPKLISAQIIGVIRKVCIADLLGTLVEIVVGEWEHGHDMLVWKQAIELFSHELGQADKNGDEEMRSNLREFCDKHHDTPRFNLIVLSLRQGMGN
jgi:hypothetical protein